MDQETLAREIYIADVQARSIMAAVAENECPSAPIPSWSEAADDTKDICRMIAAHLLQICNISRIMILCFGCNKAIPYNPPYPPNEQLCDECSNIIGEMIKDGTP